MRAVPVWTDRVADSGNEPQPILDICCRPDGAQVAAASSHRVMLYDAITGELEHSLKLHKGTVYTVSYSGDSKRFASGSADKTVIIWAAKGEAILRYPHGDAVQCVCYNAVTAQLASVAVSDVGIWSVDNKNVPKHKLPSKGLCCSWTVDGQHLAIGMYGGQISIRSKSGEEKTSIRRAAPIWTLAWNPGKDEAADVLCVGSWDAKLSFYHVGGKQIGKDKDLGFDPCVVSYYVNGDYLLVGGSDRKVGMYTRDGTFLVHVTEMKDWVWTAKHRPRHSVVAVGCNDGTIVMIHLIFSPVHAMYSDYYISREQMTDAVIQVMSTERRVRIPCRDYIRRLAIYRNRIAVMLPEKVIIYEILGEDQFDLKYAIYERVNKVFDCHLMCVVSENLVMCVGGVLSCYGFDGIKSREWTLEDSVTYIKIVGGPPEHESLLVGLKSGHVYKIFIDNAFPIFLMKVSSLVRCLDLSASRMKLAVVDDSLTCHVYSLVNNELIFSESNATGVSWNTDFEDMLCYSGGGSFYVKAGLLPPHQQRIPGLVIGFKASKIFCLHHSPLTFEVPHSFSLHRYVERKEFANAYGVACLGSTEADWKMLGMHAMTHLNFEVARKAFIRVRDAKYVELLNRVELDRKLSGTEDVSLYGDVLAFQGKYAEASKVFIRSELNTRAVEMYCDLNMWEEARAVCANEQHVKELVRRQARWTEDSGDLNEAAKLWLASGDFVRAIKLMGARGSVEDLLEVCRTLPKTDVATIGECGAHFWHHGAYNYAIEAFEKIEDYTSMVDLYVDQYKWSDAFRLLGRVPQCTSQVYVGYAAWLAINDRFEEAQEAFRKAKRPDEALRLMEQLAINSVLTRRFQEAAFCYFKLAQDTGVPVKSDAADVSTDVTETEASSALVVRGGVNPRATTKAPPMSITTLVERRELFLWRAELYYAYSFVYRYVTQPFTTQCQKPNATFNAAKFVLAMTADSKEVPMNIAKVDVLLALGRLANKFEMFRLARTVHDRLQQYVVPASLQDSLDTATMILRGRPQTDREELQHQCYRCGHTSPSLPAPGDRCTHCCHPFVRCFSTFDVLPLVEFVLEKDITDAEAERYLNHGGLVKSKTTTAASDKRKGAPPTDTGGAEVMMLDEDLVDVALAVEGEQSNDPFVRQVMHLELTGRTKEYHPITCNAELFLSLNMSELFAVKRSFGGLPLANKYYRNVQPGEMLITQCTSCGHFFKPDEHEFDVLRTGGCPFCHFSESKKTPSLLA